jgi:septation ring formation regulator EzrA
MNPLVRKQFQQLNAQLGRLHEAVVAQRAQNARQQKAREELLQNFWRTEKEVATLQAGQQAYTELQARNRELEALTTTLEEELTAVHAHLKSLREALTP